MGDCSIRSLWGVLESILGRVLSRTMLSDLVCTERGMTAVLDGRAPLAARRTGGGR
jgi:hypothetical protein